MNQVEKQLESFHFSQLQDSHISLFEFGTPMLEKYESREFTLCKVCTTFLALIRLVRIPKQSKN